jgi:hypothetical protein
VASGARVVAVQRVDAVKKQQAPEIREIGLDAAPKPVWQRQFDAPREIILTKHAREPGGEARPTVVVGMDDERQRRRPDDRSGNQ